MKNFLIKLALTLWVIWWLTLVASSCSPRTGAQVVKKEQKYYSYEAAMKRTKNNK
jgi:hypothetical protein